MTTISQQISELLLRYSVDQQSVAAVLATERTVQKELNQTAALGTSLRDVYAQVAASQALAVRTQGIDKLANEWQRVYKETNSATRANLELAASLKAVGASTSEIERVSQAVARLREEEEKRSGIRGSLLNGQSFRQVGFSLRSIPGGGLPETIGRLAPLADVAADVAEGTSKAGGALLAFTGILVGVGVVAQLVAKNIQDATAEAKRQLDLELRYRREARELADRELREQVSSLQAELDRERGTLSGIGRDLELARARSQTQVAGGGSALEALFSGAALAEIADLNALQQQYDEQQKVVDGLETQIQQYNTTLYNNENAIANLNDAVRQAIELDQTTYTQRQEMIATNEFEIATLERLIATEQEGSEVRRYAESQIQRLTADNEKLANTFGTTADRVEANDIRLEQFNDKLAFMLRLQEMDAEEREKLAASIRLQIAVQEDLASAYDATDPRAGAASRAIDVLNGQLAELENTASTNADVLNHLNGIQDNLKDSTDAYLDSITAAGEAFEEAVKQWTDAQNEAAAKIDEINAEAAEKRADLEADAAEKIADIQQQNNEARQEAEADHLAKIAEINRKADQDFKNAVYARDALRAYEIRQQQAEDLKKEQDNYDKRLKELEKQLDKQTEAQKKQLEKQLRNLEDNAAKQIRQVQQRLAKEEQLYRQAEIQRQVDLNNSLRQLEAIQKASLQSQAFQTQNFYQTAQSIQEVYQNTALFKAQAFWNAMVALVPVAGSGGGYTPTLPPIGVGLASARGGERMMIPARSGGGGSTNIFHINLDGETIRVTSRQEALNVIGRRLDKVGVR